LLAIAQELCTRVGDEILYTLNRARLRLDSGDKIDGKVEELTENVIHLSHLSGTELLDAFVDVESISAVIVRASGK
jgi:hypothetical protein